MATLSDILPHATDIQYTEVRGSPHETYDGGHMQVTRTFDVAWADRVHFAQFALGYSFIDTAGGNEYVYRRIPMHAEDWPNYKEPPFDAGTHAGAWLFATKIQSIEGRGLYGRTVGNQFTAYKKARVTLLFESLTYKVRTDDEVAVPVTGGSAPDEGTLRRYVTRQFHPTVEALILPRGAYKWVGTSVPVPNTNVRLQPSQEVIYTWHQVPGIPEAARRQLGTVNEDGSNTTLPFDPEFRPTGDLDGGYFSGTLLYMACEIRPLRNLLGRKVYDIVYKFKHLDQNPDDEAVTADGGPYRGHNYFLRYQAGEAAAYRLVTRDGAVNGDRVFQSSRFADLFRGPFLYEPDEAPE